MLNILIADDSSMLRSHLKKLLTLTINPETAIHETHSVISTLNQLEVELPDVLILDIQLPDGTGMDVLKYLATRERKPLIIILTNFPNENNKRHCFEWGADYFFDKSNEYEKVISVLENYIRREA